MFFHKGAESFALERQRPDSLFGTYGQAMDGFDKHSKLANQLTGPQVLNEDLAIFDLGASGFATHDEVRSIARLTFGDQVFTGFKKGFLASCRDHAKLSFRQPYE